MQVKFVPEAHIERAADGLLVAYGQKFGEITCPPIPAEEILECHLELSLDFDDMESRCGEPDVLGAIWMDDREVWVDQSLDPTASPGKEGRYRFTVAHETGHWVVHRHQVAHAKRAPLFDGRPAPSIVCRATGKREFIEIQADKFASYLLMPEEMVRRQWRELAGSPEPYVAQDEIAELTRRQGPSVDGMVPTVDVARRMAAAFKVSGQAMQIRLTKLNLVLLKKPEPTLFG